MTVQEIIDRIDRLGYLTRRHNEDPSRNPENRKPDGDPIGASVTEAIAWASGEEWRSRPSLVPPDVIGWVSALCASASDADRWGEIRPRLAAVIEASGDPQDVEARLWAMRDWTVREYAPSWLEIVPGKTQDAATLRGLPVLTGPKVGAEVGPVVAGIRDGLTRVQLHARELTSWHAMKLAVLGPAAEAVGRGTSAATDAAWSIAMRSLSIMLSGSDDPGSTSKETLAAVATAMRASGLDLLDRMLAVGV